MITFATLELLIFLGPLMPLSNISWRFVPSGVAGRGWGDLRTIRRGVVTVLLLEKCSVGEHYSRENEKKDGVRFVKKSFVLNAFLPWHSVMGLFP